MRSISWVLNSVVGRHGSHGSYALRKPVRTLSNLFEAVAEAAWRDLYVNRVGAYRDLLK
jgi:hypothetical protein